MLISTNLLLDLPSHIHRFHSELRSVYVAWNMFASITAKTRRSHPHAHRMEREEMLQLYRDEKDSNVKYRRMLNIKVRFDSASITQTAWPLGKVASWGSKCLNRFAKMVWGGDCGTCLGPEGQRGSRKRQRKYGGR